LCNIPHCCLPEESGPCLSPRPADHPLRPATRRRLGRPLPHQLPDRPQTHLPANCSFSTKGHPLLATCGISCGFPQLSPTAEAGCLRVTRPFATNPCGSVRLAYLRRAASVRPEPGSNSPQEKVSAETLTLLCRSTAERYFFDQSRSSGPKGHSWHVHSLPCPKAGDRA
jgi:hypothetical protein